MIRMNKTFSHNNIRIITIFFIIIAAAICVFSDNHNVYSYEVGDTVKTWTNVGINEGDISAELTVVSDDGLYKLTLTGQGDIKEQSLASGYAWYDYRVYITEISIDPRITGIPKEAFQVFKNLKAVSFGDNSQMANIGRSAFYQCVNLESITVPASVKSIGDSAFAKCSALETVGFAEGSVLESIGNTVFESCSGLKSVNIPDTVKSLGEKAFIDCSALEDTGISSSSLIGSIGKQAFKGCKSLKSIVIPINLMGIDENMFSTCSGLSTVTIPSNAKLKTIGKYAFSGCRNLLNINIPDSVETIGEYAFYNCVGVTDINITDESSIKAFPTSVFRGCSALKTINLPNGLVSIGSYAFQNCAVLNDIEFPSGLKSIGEYAFEGCSALTAAAIPDSVTEISKYAFNSCAALTDVTLPNSLVTLSEYTFANCKSLERIEIPETVTAIGNRAFAECEKLSAVVLPSGLESIGEWAFYNCYLLEDINIPTTVTSMGASVFYACRSLAAADIPSGIGRISENMFYDCRSLLSIEIPSNVTRVEANAFSGCSALESVEVHISRGEGIAFGTKVFNSTEKLAANKIVYVLDNADNQGYSLDGVTFGTTNLLGDENNRYTHSEKPEDIIVKSNYKPFAPQAYIDSVALEDTFEYSYDESKFVAIERAAGTEKSDIYFTLDGSIPSESSTRYTEPFLIDKTCTLKYRVIETGCLNSEVKSAEIKISRTITYNYEENGGNSATISSQTVQYTDVVLLDAAVENTPRANKDGYEFLGWNTDKDSHTVLTSISGIESDTTLYAIYKKKVFAIFKDSSKESTLSVDYYNNEDISQATVKAPGITRHKEKNWDIAGWRFAKNEDFGETTPRPEIYPASRQIPIRSGDMFEAVYTKKIALKYNTGTGATTIPDEVCVISTYSITEGEDRSIEYFTVTQDVPKRTGYFFRGWGGSAAATVGEYQAEQKIYTEALEENFNLYAIWTRKSYELTLVNTEGLLGQNLNYAYKESNEAIYTVRNTGNSEITNLKASLNTSGFMLSPLTKTTLNPGEEMQVSVKFPMDMNAGTYTDTLMIVGDNMDDPFGINLEQRVIPHKISIKSATAADKVYDGKNDATVQTIEFDGIDGFNFTPAEYTLRAEFSDPNVSSDPDTNEVLDKEVIIIVNLTSGNFVMDFNEYSGAKAKILRAEVPSIPEDSLTTKCSQKYLNDITDMLPEGWTWNEFSPITSGEKYLAVYQNVNNYNNSTKEIIVNISTHHTFSSKVTATPTCITEGVMTFTCECGESYTEPINKDPDNHIDVTEEVKTPSNCVEEGVMSCFCNDCGTAFERAIPIDPKTHKGYVGKYITEPTCQHKGLMRRTCYCGDYYDIIVDIKSDTHEYERTITKVATCIEEGYANYDCLCGDHYSAPLPRDPDNHVGYEYYETKAATCQNKGIRTKRCSGCGYEETEEIEINPLNHEDYTSEVTIQATCQKTGVRTYTCICGHSYTEDIPIDRNYHVDFTDTVLKAPTCVETGVTRHTCVCGYYEDEITPLNLNNHRYKAVPLVQPTCVDPGEIEYTCQDCGYKYVAENVKNPEKHTILNGHITKEATCQSEGIMTYTCEGCGVDVKTEPIAKNPDRHMDFKTKIIKQATCRTEGVREYTCLCGYSYTENMPIDMQNHEYPISYKFTVMPTCIKSGERLCTYACGHSYTEEVPVNLSNHSYEGVVEVEPTCQAEGIMRYTCKDCFKNYIETISKNPNRHVDYTEESVKTANCSNYGQIKHTCLCGYYYIEETPINPLVHSALITRVDKVPNCVEEGVQVLRCSGCGYSETETLPRDPENHIHYTEEVELPATCSETGVMRHICEGCGADYTTVISVNPYNHSFVDGVCEYCGSTEDDVILSKVKSEYDGSNYSWEYMVKVKEGIAKSPVLIFVAYGLDGAVAGITITEIEPTENAVSVTGVTECTAPARTYKIFLWDGLEHIRPLTFITK